MQTKLTINNPREMQELWKELSKKHKKILLYGELWAGKTLLTKWFASWLGINTHVVQSPTYTYINIYNNTIQNNNRDKKNNNKQLLHIDMYRLETHDEVINKGILEEIYNHDYIIIERPKFEEVIHYIDFLRIEIKKISDTQRELIFS